MKKNKPPNKIIAINKTRIKEHANKQDIIVIVGLNASGKSDLAIRLAKKYNGEIISADSRQVYKGMDIGTGKVPRDKIKNTRKDYEKNYYFSDKIRHYLLDVVNPKKVFTVDDYKHYAKKAISEISQHGKIPIICGGTGFYIDALIYDMPIPHVPPDKKLRKILGGKSINTLFRQLSIADPKRAQSIDRHNKQRLIRALEIVLTTKAPVPLLPKNCKLKTSNFNVLWLGITWPQETLNDRIRTRLEKRLNRGMIREVTKLHNQGVSFKRLESFGLEYRWIAQYLEKKISKEEMKNGLFNSIVRYSKRQMTWFKQNQNIHWIKNFTDAQRQIKKLVHFPRSAVSLP